jgi:hypothetical protein
MLYFCLKCPLVFSVKVSDEKTQSFNWFKKSFMLRLKGRVILFYLVNTIRLALSTSKKTSHDNRDPAKGPLMKHQQLIPKRNPPPFLYPTQPPAM